MEVVRSLNYFVRRFETNRKNMRLNIQSGSSLSPNDLVRIQLPSNALIDLSTFELTSDLTVSGNTGTITSGRISGTHNLVKRANVVVGGVNVGSSDNHFGLVREAWKRASYGQSWNKSNVASCQNIQRASDNDGSSTATANYQNGSGHRSFNYWALSGMDINGSGILDTSLFGDCSIEVQFDGNTALNERTATGNDPSCTWAGTNLRAFVDCLFMPNSDYASALADRLNGGGEVRAICPNIVSSVQQNTNSNEFNVSTQCLSGVLIAGLHQDYATERNHRFPAVHTDGTVSTVAQLNSKNYHLSIGSESYPAYGNVLDGMDGAEMTRKMVGKDSPYNYNQLYVNVHEETSAGALTLTSGYRQQNYCSYNFLIGFDTSLEGIGSLHDSKLCSGISTQGGNSVMRFTSSGFNSSAYWLLAGICDAYLIAKSGQVVSFVA